MAKKGSKRKQSKSKSGMAGKKASPVALVAPADQGRDPEPTPRVTDDVPAPVAASRPPENRPVAADPPTGSSERRIWRRVPFFRKVQYRFDSLEEFTSEMANDLSLGGMFIKTENPEAVGTVIFLEFELKDGSRIMKGYGKVVRVNPVGDPDFDAGMGIEFLKFDDESITRIRELVSDRFNRP